MYNNDAQKVRTSEVRLSYAHLNQPYASATIPNAIPKYSTALLIPKSDIALIDEIRSAIRAAATAATTSVWGGYCLPDDSLFSLIKDGDGVKRDGKPYGPEAKGCWIINATAGVNQKPAVVHVSNVKSELAPEDVYSGMYARVMLRFYGTNKGGNKMCCGLGNIMKTRDGEHLDSGKTEAADDFADLESQIAAAGVTVNPLTGETIPAVNPLTGLSA